MITSTTVVTGALLLAVVLSLGISAMRKKKRPERSETEKAGSAFLQELGIDERSRSLDSDFKASQEIVRAALRGDHASTRAKR